MLESANAAFFTAIGGPERARTSVPLGQLMPELVEQGFIELLDRVYRSGTAYTGRDARMTLGEASQAREAFFDFTYEPRLDAGGNVMGVRVIGVETTRVKHAQRLTAEHRALLEQIARQAPLPDVLDGMARAIEDLAPEEVDDFRDLADQAGVAACWSTPILARDGSLLGTFAMYHRAPRAPQEADLALAQLFAGTAALAIERHQTEQARQAAENSEKAAREDLAFLLRASTTLSSNLDATHTLVRLADTCTPRLAPLCTIDVIEGGRVRRVAAAAPTEQQQNLLAGHIPVYDAADDAVARVLASGVSEVARRTPTGPGPWHTLGVTGYLCIPLLDRGAAFGAVTLLSTGDHSFDGHTVALAEELVSRAALAARNARQFTQRATLASDLQAGLLLPDLPRVPGVEVATYYHPAGEGLDIGGDFYDVFPLEDGRWAFLLGDVCGRGAIAATTTALVRHTARAVAPLVPGPQAVVEAINRALLNRPTRHGTGFVTLVYGQLTPTPSGPDIELVRAGHALPMHLDARCAVHLLDAPGALLGIGADTHLAVRRLHLRPNESLVLYTDGITEARRRNDDLFGEGRLAEALRSTPAHPAPQHLIDAIVQAVHAFSGGHDIDDDQAILVLTATDPIPDKV
ncbi:GAF domain-containing SpoIIE family protein phosphatase [Streptomyces sp. NPDC005244]|uniref:GAF domain-containing SpoIIE family protein phosphatase n=1 Tax=Streptomyces sp. NPDC005244 TaxID=3364708 RepID=UPI0036B7998D